jgi:hypothetical protein
VEPGAGVTPGGRRGLHPGEVVSYFGGLKTRPDRMFLPNMTEAEIWEAGGYHIGLEGPAWWGVERGAVVDNRGEGVRRTPCLPMLG